jgi:hypothetical protein
LDGQVLYHHWCHGDEHRLGDRDGQDHAAAGLAAQEHERMNDFQLLG